MYERDACKALAKRLREPRRFIQVLAGPRQTGKTTITRQVRETLSGPFVYASADEPTLKSGTWIEQQWDVARLEVPKTGRRRGATLFLDEIHKIPGWAERVKALWDADTESGTPLKVVLLGSSPWAMQHGLGESLAGRFEAIRVPHWSYAEMRDAFGFDLERYVLFGGYPGAAALVRDPDRWAAYIRDSIVETTLARDILLMTRVDKPALLRRLFDLACACSGTILSYQKMTGQLQDAGNTTTLAHYLDLLQGAGIACGLEKFAGHVARQRGSSPKLQVLDNAFVTARSPAHAAGARRDPEAWGRRCESAVGAHLANARMETGVEVFYWRDRGREVDFVIRSGDVTVAIEVKSGRSPTSLPGMDAFVAAHRPRRTLLVGTGGIPFEEFLGASVGEWLR